MPGETFHTIGELARLTGLTVKTIRFYADTGIVAPTDRTVAGHRRYDAAAASRLCLVRTLRELGLDLASIRAVLRRDASVAEVAATHAEALAAHIRTLRLRHAVLTAVARRGSSTEETTLMHHLARLSADERRRLVDDFLDAALGDLRVRDEFTGIARSMTPELPEDPTAEQVDAWVELAQLSRQPDFRAAVHRMARHLAADRDAGRTVGGDAPVRPDAVAMARDAAGPALAAGLDPGSPAAGQVVAGVTARYAAACGHPDDAALRHRLETRLAAAHDPRRERYLELLSIINGWPSSPGRLPELDWFIRALRPRP